MGIPGLGETIEACEEIIPIAQLAEEHFARTKRPLKIAVDEADWRFNNVSPQQVAAIRRYQPAANPVEKAMFYRVCNLLTLNIELVFVSDGPDVPPKRGRTQHGRKINHEDRALLKEVLQCFGIPYVHAPGEAEAECCHLQRLGLVDAVWSQDSDCLMFGCTLWLRDHRITKEEGYDNRNKGHTKKAAKQVRVVRAHDLSAKHRLKREGCVLFAMLAGGDYDSTGLVGCGTVTALRAAQSGLGHSLCRSTSQEDCRRWREHVLLPYFSKEKVPIAVPASFPSFSTLQMYNEPKVHQESFHRRDIQLAPSYQRSMDEFAMFEVTGSRFNIWAVLYLESVVPTMLTQFLANRNSTLAHEHVHEIELLRSRTPRNQNTHLDHFKTKIRFSPVGLTKLLRGTSSGSWMWILHPFNTFDSIPRVECEIPTYLLRKVLPPELFASPVPNPRVQSPKRKHNDSVTPHGEQPTSTTKKSRKAQTSAELAASDDLRLPKPRVRQSPTLYRVSNGYLSDKADGSDRPTVQSQKNRSCENDGVLGHSYAIQDELFEQEDLDLQRALRLSLEMSSATNTPVKVAESLTKTSAKRSTYPEIIDLT